MTPRSRHSLRHHAVRANSIYRQARVHKQTHSAARVCPRPTRGSASAPPSRHQARGNTTSRAFVGSYRLPPYLDRGLSRLVIVAIFFRLVAFILRR